MIPKFRAWDKESKETLHVRGVSFYPPVVRCQVMDYEEGRVSEINLALKDVELMQSTGLKDKNGVEIYFDDALTDGRMTRLVIWREDDSQIQLSVDDAEYENRIKLTQNMINTFELTICGNIYENPKLLEVEG